MRRLPLSDMMLAFVVLTFLIILLFAPIAIVVIDSLRSSDRFSLQYYWEFITTPFYVESFINSLIWASLTVVATSILGVPLAYILSRYDLPWRSRIKALLTIPIVTPPFVGAMALINLFGSYGTINVILVEFLRWVEEPVNLIFGLHGLVFVQAIHLFPLIVLNTDFSSINTEYEELAEVHGASGLSRFFKVTWPLAMPSYANGAFLVFIFTFVDFATPMVLRETRYIATEAVSAILYSFLDVRLYRLGLVSTVIITLFTVVALIAVRKWVERKRYHLRGTGRLLRVDGARRALYLGFCWFMVAVGLLVPIWILLSSISKAWAFTALPTRLTLDNFKMILVDTPLYVSNSLVYSGIALTIDLLLGIGVAYLLTRTDIPGKDLLDGLTTFILAVPGIIIGVGYAILFGQPILGYSLARNWVVMPLVMAVRRLPYMVRPMYGAFLGLDRWLEDVATVFGARRHSVMLRITLPLTKRLVTAGALFTFVNAFQELSSTIFLYRPGWETVPIGIFILFQSSGFFEAAAALGVVLMLVVGICIALALSLGERVMAYRVA